MLYFIPVEDFGSQNPFIQMKWDGFNLDIDPTDEATIFNIRQFHNLISTKTGPGVALNPVNHFLKTLSITDQEAIASSMLLAHITIMEAGETEEEILEVERVVGEIFDDLDLAIDLCGKCEEFAKTSDIPISNMSEAGTQPQHTPEMTFHYDEAVTITAIAIFVKLVTGVLGAFTNKYNAVIDTEYKISHARAMLTPLHARRYKPLMLKLKNYLERLIENKCKLEKKPSPTAAYHGQTLDNMTRREFDNAIVTRLICIDLYLPDGNSIKYIAASCKNGASSKQRNAENNGNVRFMTDPSEQDPKDEGNASRMEIGSRQSVKTADTPIIVETYARQMITNIIASENISQEQFNQAKLYYQAHPICLGNPFMEYLLCLTYGPELGSGEYLGFLSSPVITDLCILFQMTIGEMIPTLGHIVTADIPNTPRNPVGTDLMFINAWQNLPEYTECRKNSPAGFGEIEWNTKFKSLAETLLNNVFVYSTAPIIWERIEPDKDPQNGKVITDFTAVMKYVISCTGARYTGE